MYDFLLIFLICLNGWFTSRLAKGRGRNPAAWFWAGALFFLPSLIALYFLPKLNKEEPLPKREEEPVPPPCETWFYLDQNRQQIGPISFESLKEIWVEKKIHMKTFVWRPELEEWKKIQDLPDLLAHL